MKKVIFTLLFVMIFIFKLSGQTDPMLKTIFELYNNESDHELVIEYLLDAVKENPGKLESDSQLITETLKTYMGYQQTNFNLYLLMLSLVETNLFTIDSGVENKIFSIFMEEREYIEMDQRVDYQEWIWNDYFYLIRRQKVGILLGLLGFIDSKKSIDELEYTLSHMVDNKLKLYSALSLIRLNQRVPQNELLSIAQDDETRGILFSLLKLMNKHDLFPGKYKTQEFLAKSDMVLWLIRKEEFSRTPDEIELLKIFTFSYAEIGDADYYLWKFRSGNENLVDYGWMVGLSGPFLKSEEPTEVSRGYTYSAFLGLDEKTIDEHFQHIVDILEK